MITPKDQGLLYAEFLKSHNIKRIPLFPLKKSKKSYSWQAQFWLLHGLLYEHKSYAYDRSNAPGFDAPYVDHEGKASYQDLLDLKREAETLHGYMFHDVDLRDYDPAFYIKEVKKEVRRGRQACLL